MTGFLTEIRSVYPQSPIGDSPGGACGSASLRRHLHCFGFTDGNLADVPVRPCWALLTEILSVHPQSPDGDSPGGACGSASLRRHLHCFGFLPESSLTFRCGPEGPY